MKRVILESPYAGQVDRNLIYARAAMADSIRNHSEAPFASHLLYTQPGVLDDADAAERALGINAGLLWAREALATVVYRDLGISKGMEQGIAHASTYGRPVEFRSLPDELLLWFANQAVECGDPLFPVEVKNRLVKLNWMTP